MPQTKALFLKHKHHIITLAQGKPHERAYVIKTAPASLEPLLHKIAVNAVEGRVHIPVAHRTKAKIDKLVRYASSPAEQRRKMLRPNQHGSGILTALLGAIAGPVLGLLGVK